MAVYITAKFRNVTNGAQCKNYKFRPYSFTFALTYIYIVMFHCMSKPLVLLERLLSTELAAPTMDPLP